MSLMIWAFLVTDIYGHEVLRAAGVLQESYQQSKCLTHEFQIDLCKERIE